MHQQGTSKHSGQYLCLTETSVGFLDFQYGRRHNNATGSRALPDTASQRSPDLESEKGLLHVCVYPKLSVSMSKLEKTPI